MKVPIESVQVESIGSHILLSNKLRSTQRTWADQEVQPCVRDQRVHELDVLLEREAMKACLPEFDEKSEGRGDRGGGRSGAGQGVTQQGDKGVQFGGGKLLLQTRNHKQEQSILATNSS